jgi:muconolactone delta-isomerase
MATFIVICTFKPDTNMDDVFAVAAEEMAQVKALEDAGRLGPVKLSLARGTVFLEVFAADAAAAEATVHTLPMAKWWSLDVFPIAAPTVPGPAS